MTTTLKNWARELNFNSSRAFYGKLSGLEAHGCISTRSRVIVFTNRQTDRQTDNKFYLRRSTGLAKRSANYAGLAPHHQLGKRRDLPVARVASEAVGKSLVRFKYSKITNLERKYHFPPFFTEIFRNRTLWMSTWSDPIAIWMRKCALWPRNFTAAAHQAAPLTRCSQLQDVIWH